MNLQYWNKRVLNIDAYKCIIYVYIPHIILVYYKKKEPIA